MSDSLIDYAQLLQRALRSVAQGVLARAAEEGFPGEHHVYLTVRIDAPGVEVPPFLRQRYPEEMTVVLQHQYQDLVVDDAGFAVTLRFDGSPARLLVPWEAVVAFFDPAAEFGLRFDLAELGGKKKAAGPTAVKDEPPAPATAPSDPPALEGTDPTVGASASEGNGKLLTFGQRAPRRDEE